MPFLGMRRSQLVDPDSRRQPNQLEPVPGQPAGRYIMELNKSGASVATDGPADTPHAVTLTSPFNNETAPAVATAARSLTKAILGDDTQYGEWAGKAIHKCEPGFAIDGEFKTAGPNPSTAEVKMQRTIVNRVEVLVIRFRRTK
jgi:hypothetical protein